MMGGWLLFPSLGESVKLPNAPHTLHDRIYGYSAQEAIKPGCAPGPEVGSMQHDAEGDMASDPQAQSKNNPLAHHVNKLGLKPDEKE
jgi:hypothetical protein